MIQRVFVLASHCPDSQIQGYAVQATAMYLT